jgi:predicted dehydrogenase
VSEVRFGIIGAGNMGSQHARTLTSGRIRGGRLAAICDVSPKALQGYGDLPVFARSDELIGSGAVDAVLIATPHYFHTTIGIAALQAGLHVLVEKPISVHKADCERLIAAHRASRPGQGPGRQVFAAMFNQRTDPVYRRMRRMIGEGELGDIFRVSWIITNWFRTHAYYASGDWRATWRGEGGGVLLNQCPHQIDLWQWLFGMPARVHAFAAFGKRHPIEVEDEVTAYFEYASGATGTFITSTGEYPGSNRLEISGDRGRLVFEGDRLSRDGTTVRVSEYGRTSPERFKGPGVWRAEVLESDRGPQHAGIIQNFVDAILDGAPLIAPAEEGIRSVELANAMMYSALEKRTIDLPLDGAAYEARLNSLIDGSRPPRAGR